MAEEKVVTEEVESESQFSFRNMGKAIIKFKWWIIGVSVVGAVGGYLGFRLGLNNTREKMVSTFSYDINANPKEELTGEKVTNEDRANQQLYLSDGSLFSFTDVISESRMKAVQEANPEFSKLNIAKIVKDGGMQIERKSYTDPSTSKTVFEYPARYTISATRKHFSSKQQAKDFIEALVSYELKVAEAANNIYEVEDYLSDNSSASYGLFVKNLKDQYTAIKDCYTNLLEDFANSSLADGEGNSLNKVYSNFIASYAEGASNILEKYEGDLYNQHLVDYANVTPESLTQQAEAYKQNLKSSLLLLDTYQNQLNSLTSAGLILNGNSEVTEEIIKLNKKIIEIGEQNGFYTKELINLGYTVATPVTLANVDAIAYAGDGEQGVIQSLKANTAEWKAACDAFKTNLDRASTKLKVDRTTVGDVYGFVNNKYNNQANFYTPGVAKLEGHTSNIIGAAAGLVGGFVLSTLIFTTIYIYRRGKEEK